MLGCDEPSIIISVVGVMNLGGINTLCFECQVGT